MAPNKEISLAETASSSSAHHSARRSLLLRDCVIGFADGLTVPFALTAGLSALGDSHLVVMGGLAELLAGAVSMGLGAYLAAITEDKRYQVEEREVRREVKKGEGNACVEVLLRYGVRGDVARGVLEDLRGDEEGEVQFRMDFDLKLARPEPKMAWIEGCVMGMSYLMGGLLPMIPYFAGFKNVNHALFISIGITVVILMTFGYVKAMVTGTTRKEAIWVTAQTLCVGALAAGVSYGIVYGLNKVM